MRFHTKVTIVESPGLLNKADVAQSLHFYSWLPNNLICESTSLAQEQFYHTFWSDSSTLSSIFMLWFQRWKYLTLVSKQLFNTVYISLTQTALSPDGILRHDLWRRPTSSDQNSGAMGSGQHADCSHQPEILQWPLAGGQISSRPQSSAAARQKLTSDWTGRLSEGTVIGMWRGEGHCWFLQKFFWWFVCALKPNSLWLRQFPCSS